MKVPVDAAALRQVLVALNGPGHYIRELMAIRDLGNSPIDALLEQFNEAIKNGPWIQEKILWSSDGVFRLEPERVRVLLGSGVALEIQCRDQIRRIDLDNDLAAALSTALAAKAGRSKDPVQGLPEYLRVRSTSLGEPYREAVEIDLGKETDAISITLLKEDALSLSRAILPRPAPTPLPVGQIQMSGM